MPSTIDLQLLIEGLDSDSEGRCLHWHDAKDVLVVQFPCCSRWFACFDCHAALCDHPPARWQVSEFASEALLCGRCRKRFSISHYLQGTHRCPHCGGAFNPGCSHHHHLYFAGLAEK